MNIAYLWIEKYKNIENQGFHFNHEISVEISSYKERSPETDFNLEIILRRGNNGGKLWIYNKNISNITAIVGENGAGKTSLMEFLFNEVGQNNSNYFYLAIVKISDNYAIYTNVFSYKYDNPDDIEIEIVDYYKYDLKFDKIFYSNLFDYNISLYSNRNYDLTTTNQAKNFSTFQEQDFYRLNYIDFYRIEELNKQIEFIGSKYVKELPIDIPQIIKLDLKDLRRLTRNEKFTLYASEKKFKLDNLIKLEDQLFPKPENSIKQNIANYLLFDLISTIMWQSMEDLDRLNSVFLPTPKNDWSVEKVIKYFKHIQKIKKYDIGNDYFKYKIEFLYYLRDNEIYEVYDISSNSLNIFKTFINRYKKSLYNDSGFLNFSWYQTSSGETAMINLFSRFYSIKSQIKNTDLVIFLDEAETGFHPMWQKQMVGILNNFLPKLFPTNNMQLFITSHSPYILSDLPRENIIFLKKVNKKCKIDNGINHNKTFGANILDLFSDAFFLDSTIGTFAFDEIKKAINIALSETNSQKDLIYAKYIASIIGDEVISYKLKKLLSVYVTNNQ